MRRALLSVFGIAALSLATPGVALARHHHHHHHKASSKAHHARVHFVHITPAGTVAPADKDEPTPEPPPSTSEGAGKIASFSEGVLTITLNDGSSVSGKVTDRTEIKCETAEMPGVEGERKEMGDDRGSGDDRDGSEGEDKGGGEGDDGEVEVAPQPPCDSSALTPGTVVREAELRVSPTGAEFESIELVR